MKHDVGHGIRPPNRKLSLSTRPDLSGGTAIANLRFNLCGGIKPSIQSQPAAEALVRFAPIVLKKSALQRFRPSRDIGSAERGSPSSGRRLRDRDQLGELAEVLGGGSEEELVLGTIRAPQAQAVQLQDALEVGEQHLDLLPLAA